MDIRRRKSVVGVAGIAAGLSALLALASGGAAIANAARSPSSHATVPVLGSKKFDLPAGSGFGTAHPKKIDNGGDPSGIAYGLSWAHWGHATSIAHGTTNVPKRSGGYYAHRGRIEFRASDLGSCSASGPLAYRHLHARVAAPGKSFGKWFAWGDAKTICRR
jgi:hypothetical protein